MFPTKLGAAGMIPYVRDKVMLRLWDDIVLQTGLMASADEPDWLKPQNSYSIHENYYVYIRKGLSVHFRTRPFGHLYVENSHNLIGHLPKEAEAIFADTNFYANFFQPYNVSNPHSIPQSGQGLREGYGDGRIYVAIKGTRLFEWATLNMQTDTHLPKK